MPENSEDGSPEPENPANDYQNEYAALVPETEVERPPLRAEDFLDRPGELRRQLEAKSTLQFTPYASGLFPASDLTPEMRAATGMGMAWLRDNAHVAYALYQAGKTDLATPAAKAMLQVLDNNHDLLEIVATSSAAPDSLGRLPARVDGDTLENDTQHRVQNDSVGYALWYVGRLINDGALEPTEEDLVNLGLTARYLEKHEYWHDPDEGHWEEDSRIHASSIGAAMAGLRETKLIFKAHGRQTDIDFDRLIAKGEAELRQIFSSGQTDVPPDVSPKLGELMPETVDTNDRVRELLENFTTHRRKYDASLLFLIEPLDVLHGAEAEKIVADIENNLVRDIGTSRYSGDTYWEPRFPHIMGLGDRTTPAPGRTEWRNQTAAGIALTETEAQWTLFDPVLSTYYGKRYLAEVNAEDREKQLVYLNRSLAQAVPQPDGRLLLPEAYYLEFVGDDGKDNHGHNQWIPNDHVPLLWSQANLLNALRLFEQTSANPNLGH